MDGIVNSIASELDPVGVSRKSRSDEWSLRHVPSRERKLRSVGASVKWTRSVASASRTKSVRRGGRSAARHIKIQRVSDDVDASAMLESARDRSPKWMLAVKESLSANRRQEIALGRLSDDKKRSRWDKNVKVSLVNSMFDRILTE